MAQTEMPIKPVEPGLVRLGFTRGNPFATLEADQERDIIKDLFVEVENIERVRAARTLILHAPRGCGKSALRVLLASEAAPRNRLSTAATFAVELVNFDGLLAKQAAGESVKAEDYVNEILRLGAEALFTFLLAPGQRNPRLANLDTADQVGLGRLVWSYHAEMLAPEAALKLFNHFLPAVQPGWSEYRRAVRECRVTGLLGREVLQGSQEAALLAFLLDLEPEDRAWHPDELTGRIELLLKLVQAIGYPQLAILIDRVDEMEATQNDPRAQAELLAPLLSHLTLMEAPGISFKLFIPQDTYQVLIETHIVRTDRLEMTLLTVDWHEKRLKELLARRLMVFGRYRDLAQICSDRAGDGDEDEELPALRIEREMIRLANHSPRRLIQAGQLLLNAYLNRPDADLITLADWEVARLALESGTGPAEAMSASEQIAPPLIAPPVMAPPVMAPPVLAPPAGIRVDEEGREVPCLWVSRRRPELVIKNQTIQLSETELKIIQSLIKHNGACGSETLVDEVWGGPITDAGIDVTLKRIRDEIDKILGEKKAGLKRYLLKRAKTVMLINYQVVED